VENSIQQGYCPGAVILVGHDGEIIYRGVFGNQSILPSLMPMKIDTIVAKA